MLTLIINDDVIFDIGNVVSLYLRQYEDWFSSWLDAVKREIGMHIIRYHDER